MSHSPVASEPLFDSLAIVGVGLMGGSLAAACRERGIVRRIIGVGRNAERLAGARNVGLIDEGETDLAIAAAQADLVVFCTPVDKIVPGVHEAAQASRPGTLITDAGSTKGEICRALASGLPAGVEFIGSHPLAGSEKQGFEYADSRLYENRVCVLTPQSKDRPESIDRLRRFWRGIGSTVVEMSPEQHDVALAETSHLPHLVAAAIALGLAEQNRPLAATGFRDTTRIAAGDPELWTAIFLENAGPVLESLGRLEVTLGEFRQAIAAKDSNALRQLLQLGKESRDALGNSAASSQA